MCTVLVMVRCVIVVFMQVKAQSVLVCRADVVCPSVSVSLVDVTEQCCGAL